MRFLLPVVIFAVLAGLLGWGLTRDPREVPSPLIGKPAPAFTAPTLFDPEKKFSTSDYLGRVWVLNVWASWCVACRAEHEYINQLARMQLVPVVGLDYKDKPEDGRAWLRELGNPYTVIPTDEKGKIGIDWGVYGVPETFIIDKQGRIAYKHIGPINADSLRDIIVPKIKELL